MDKTIISNRFISIDFLRVVACYLVILYHIPQCCVYDTYSFPDIFSQVINALSFYLGRIGVPLFFLISGYLLMPSKFRMSTFISKRFARILAPTLIWMVIYSCLGNPITTNELNLIFISKCQHLWYMFALVGVYLVIPIVSPWFESASKKELAIVVSLWGVSLLFPIINHFTPIGLEYSHQGMLYTTPFHSLLYLSGYIGYIFIGGLIKKFLNELGHYILKVTITIFVTSILVFLVGLYIGVPYQDAYAYLSLPNAGISISFFLFFLYYYPKLSQYLKIKFKHNGERFMAEVARLSFGIYLLHVLVLEQIQIANMEGYIRVAISIIVFVLSLIIIKIVSYIPYSKYLIG